MVLEYRHSNPLGNRAVQYEKRTLVKEATVRLAQLDDPAAKAVREAWVDARYDDALTLAAFRRDPQSRLFAARAHMRLRQFEAVVEVLRGARLETSEEREIADILSQVARYRLSGTNHGLVVEVPANYFGSSRSLAHFYIAIDRWARNDHAGARVELGEALRLGNFETRAYAIDLLAWIEFSAKRHSNAKAYFVELLDLQLDGKWPDEHLRVNAVQGLAFCALADLDTDLLPRLVNELATVKVTPHLRRPYVGALVATASLHGLIGDFQRQYEMLLKARGATEAGFLQALVDVSCAAFHRMRGSDDARYLHLLAALNPLDDLPWATSDREVRLVALVFVSEAALARDKKAHRIYTKALSFEGKRDLSLAFEHDNHTSGTAALATARIAETRGNLEMAEVEASNALTIWLENHDRYRAAIAALDVLRMSEGREFHPILREVIRTHPKSFFASESRRLRTLQKSPLMRLGPAERRVLEKICEGLTSKEIAIELGRSHSTVRNQTISIFRKYGVTTRTALARKVRERG